MKNSRWETPMKNFQILGGRQLPLLPLPWSRPGIPMYMLIKKLIVYINLLLTLNLIIRCRPSPKKKEAFMVKIFIGMGQNLFQHFPGNVY